MQPHVYWIFRSLVSANTQTSFSHPREQISLLEKQSWCSTAQLTGSLLTSIQDGFYLCTIVEIYGVILYINFPCSTNQEGDHMLLHEAEFLHSCIFLISEKVQNFCFQSKQSLLWTFILFFLHRVCISIVCLKLKPKVVIVIGLIYY